MDGNDTERRNWNIDTHNIAVEAMTTINMHLKECEKRDLRLQDRYDKIEEILGKQDTKSDVLRQDITKMQVKIAFFLGGFFTVWELVKIGIEFAKGIH